MIRTVAVFLERIFSRWVPDTFVFTILLTFIAFVASTALTPSTLLDTLKYWGDGIWTLLSFSMQVVLILVTGHAIASSSAATRWLEFVARTTKTMRQAIIVVTIVSAICCWLNPGFGLVAGAIFATAVGKRVPDANYPLLVASAYSGYVIWHAGISGTIPLQIALPRSDALGALLPQAVPMSETTFSAPNLILCAILLITLPVLNMLMDGPGSAAPPRVSSTRVPSSEKDESTDRPIYRIENSSMLAFTLAGFSVVYLTTYFSSGGVLGLNVINLILLTVGLVLHKSPIRYINAVADATRVISGVILQYPFYGGIMGMMTASGLSATISNWFVAASTPTTFLLFTFFGAGLLNFFIPSGGGQWAVQAPIVIDSAAQAGIPLAHAAMAVAYGDMWTNLIQPFWAIPVLAISGLSIKDIMSYCVLAFLWTGAVFSFVLLFLY